MSVLPAASTVVAPGGIWTFARGPAAVMRSPFTITTELSTGAPPVPSINLAPTMAVTGPADPRWAWGAARAVRNNAVHTSGTLDSIAAPILVAGISRGAEGRPTRLPPPSGFAAVTLPD